MPVHGPRRAATLPGAIVYQGDIPMHDAVGQPARRVGRVGRVGRTVATVVTLAAASALWCAPASAASPEGRWKTVDEAGNARAVVEISESGGTLSGKIVERLNVEPGDSTVCRACPGVHKDQPYIGLPIIEGLRKTGDNEWGGGEILDPRNGKQYHCKMSLSPDGNQLEVRGYLGVSLLGRTQRWSRQQ
jgi:uncharacterized protein (DUF2147 family)